MPVKCSPPNDFVGGVVVAFSLVNCYAGVLESGHCVSGPLRTRRAYRGVGNRNDACIVDVEVRNKRRIAGEIGTERRAARRRH